MAASGAKDDRQRESTQGGTGTQYELRISRRPASASVPMQVIATQPSMTAAMNLAIAASGLTDREVAGALDIDPAQWSRIRSGQGHFPQDRLDTLCELLGNDIVLQWLADRRGFDLAPKLSTLERQLHELRTQLAERDRDLAVIKRFVQETR